MASLPAYDIYIGNTGPHAASGWTQINGTSKGAGSAFTRTAEWFPSALSFAATVDPVGDRLPVVYEMLIGSITM